MPAMLVVVATASIPNARVKLRNRLSLKSLCTLYHFKQGKVHGKIPMSLVVPGSRLNKNNQARLALSSSSRSRGDMLLDRFALYSTS